MGKWLFAFLAAAALWAAAPPQRIISAAPSVTEILYGVGAFDKVVAVSDYCTYPPAVKSLPRIGGWPTPSLERLAALRPDLVVLTEAQAPFLVEQLRQLGIPSMAVPSQTVSDVFAAIDAIGGRTGKHIEAAALASRTRAALERVRTRASRLAHPTVLCVVDRTPGTLRDLYTATQGSYLVELIELAGAKVIAPPARGGYGKISKETVLTLNPDVIFDMVQGSSGKLGEDLQAVWRDLPELKAVRTGRVTLLRDQTIVHASQMIGRTAVTFARLLHPEVPATEWGNP